MGIVHANGVVVEDSHYLDVFVRPIATVRDYCSRFQTKFSVRGGSKTEVVFRSGSGVSDAFFNNCLMYEIGPVGSDHLPWHITDHYENHFRSVAATVENAWNLLAQCGTVAIHLKPRPTHREAL